MDAPRVTTSHEDINSNTRVLRNAIRRPCNRRVASSNTSGMKVGDGPSDRKESNNSVTANIGIGYLVRIRDCSVPSMMISDVVVSD
jgi:hypothetical protein